MNLRRIPEKPDRVYNTFHNDADQLIPSFHPDRHDDGTVQIGYPLKAAEYTSETLTDAIDMDVEVR
ncbi:MAG: hypothetical protein RLZZ435_3082 [Cyanobacteriota bacterium]|jgi:hypothetical protein